MRLFKTYTDNFSLKVKRPVDRVVLALQVYIDKPKSNFIVDKLLYGEKYQQTNDTFKITRERVFFEPFRAIGQINIELLPGDTSNETKVLLRTEPLQGYKDGFAFLAFGLIIFTILGLLISTNFYTIIIILFGWTFFPLTIHFWLKWNKAKLRTYAYTFLRTVLDQSERTT